MELENLKRMFEKQDDLRLVIETFNANVEPEEFDPLEVSIDAQWELFNISYRKLVVG